MAYYQSAAERQRAIDALAHLIHTEAAAEPYAGQLAAAETAINRAAILVLSIEHFRGKGN